jgi:exosortase C (VPDSG-CTERM-specific)
MNESNKALTPESARKQNGSPGGKPRRLGALIATTAALVLAFSLPLYGLARFSIQSELYSHIFLIPLISAYLIWVQRRALPPASAPEPRLAVLPFAAGALALVIYGIAVLAGATLAREDSLVLTTLAFLLFFGGACCLFLDRPTLRAIVFPLGFLVFMVPFPVFLQTWIETVLQYGSAAVAYGFFQLSGTPFLYHDLGFRLPGFALQVAPECSGIHSTLALFITSVLAAWFFLRSPWRRATLALAVIPLALLRNGFRVFTIGELCVHIGPQMIDSPIHRHGGPLFFALSLIPFFLLLFLLMKCERRGSSRAAGSRRREKMSNPP